MICAGKISLKSTSGAVSVGTYCPDTKITMRCGNAPAKIIMLGKAGPRGPMGLTGSAGSISDDAENILTTGNDNGLFVPPPQLASEQW